MSALPARLRDPAMLLAVGGALAAAAWIAWLAALAQAGCWGAPPHAGCPRVDFSAFWGAGRLADAGRAVDAYSWPQLRAALEQAFRTGGIAPLPFLYPPPVLMASAGLGALPYGGAFAAWILAGCAAYAIAAVAILRRAEALLVAAAPAGVFFCAFAGQNGFLTAATLAGGLLLLTRRPAAAGVLLALFACKPHLALLVPVALVAGGRWRALASAAAATVLLWTAAAVVLGPEVVSAFLAGAAGGGGVFGGDGWLPWWKVQSLYGALRTAGVASPAAWIGQGALTLAAAAAVWVVWRGGARESLKAATLAAAALVASPYAFVYDGPLLALAALFLLRDARQARLTPVEAAFLAAGLFGQAAFLVAPSPWVTPLAAASLLIATRLRVMRLAPADAAMRWPERSGALAAQA